MECVKEIRERKNMTLQAIADSLGISRQAVHIWENEDRIPAKQFEGYAQACSLTKRERQELHRYMTRSGRARAKTVAEKGTNTHIGYMIRKNRIEMELTIEEFAELMHVSPTTAFNWEKGKTAPRGKQLTILCELFCVTPNELLGVEGSVADSGPNFGARMTVARETVNMSIDQCAEAMGISRATWYGWERNKNAPTADRIVGICEVLGVSPNYLAGCEYNAKKQ